MLQRAPVEHSREPSRDDSDTSRWTAVAVTVMARRHLNAEKAAERELSDAGLHVWIKL